MATIKRSISFDPELLAQLEEAAAAKPYEGNLSGLVNDALDRYLKSQRLGELLDEMDRRFGPVPDEVRERVDREWPD